MVGTYHPYRKSNEETDYIHVNSDHPPSIIKEIPRAIEKRLFVNIEKYFSEVSFLLGKIPRQQWICMYIHIQICMFINI